MTFQRLPECSTCSPGLCTPPDNAPEWCFTGPFDPEGIVSSFNAIITTVIGVHYGHGEFQFPTVRMVVGRCERIQMSPTSCLAGLLAFLCPAAVLVLPPDDLMVPPSVVLFQCSGASWTQRRECFSGRS